MSNERGRAVSERPLHRDMYVDKAGIKTGWGGMRNMSEDVARTVASLAIQDARAHPEDIQWVRIAAGAAKMAARRILELQGKMRGGKSLRRESELERSCGVASENCSYPCEVSHNRPSSRLASSRKYW